VVRNLAMSMGSSSRCSWAMPMRSTCRLGRSFPWCLTAFWRRIPVALPATFTLAARGARRAALAHLGVLPTRLSAVDEAASIDVLVRGQDGHVDSKTKLTVTAVHAMAGLTSRTFWAWLPWRARTAGRIRSMRPSGAAAAKEVVLRSAETQQVCAFRFRHEDVRGRRLWIQAVPRCAP